MIVVAVCGIFKLFSLYMDALYKDDLYIYELYMGDLNLKYLKPAALADMS